MVVLRSLAQGPPASGPTGGPRGRSGGRSRFPDLRDCLRACHRYRGASSQEAEVLVEDIAETTLKRYQLQFKCLIRHGVRTGVIPNRVTPTGLSEVPIWRWLALVKAFTLTCEPCWSRGAVEPWSTVEPCSTGVRRAAPISHSPSSEV